MAPRIELGLETRSFFNFQAVPCIYGEPTKHCSLYGGGADIIRLRKSGVPISLVVHYTAERKEAKPQSLLLPPFAPFVAPLRPSRLNSFPGEREWAPSIRERRRQQCVKPVTTMAGRNKANASSKGEAKEGPASAEKLNPLKRRPDNSP